MNHTSFLYELIEATLKYPFVSYLIYTNGNEKEAWMDMLSKQWFGEIRSRTVVRISYDGDPIHQMMRNVSSDNVLWLIDELSEFGVRYIVRSTVTLDHVDYIESSWDCFKKLRDRHPNIFYTPILDTTSDYGESLQDFRSVIRRIAEKEFDAIKEKNAPVSEWFVRSVGDCKSLRTCIRDYFVNLHTDGKFYFCYGCNSFPWADKLVIGDTKTCTNLAEMFRKYDFGPINEECSNCDAIFCFTCHAANIPYPESFEDFLSKWHKNRNTKHNRCEFYKIIGRMSRLLWRAVEANDKSLLSDPAELEKVYGGN